MDAIHAVALECFVKGLLLGADVAGFLAGHRRRDRIDPGLEIGRGALGLAPGLDESGRPRDRGALLLSRRHGRLEGVPVRGGSGIRRLRQKGGDLRVGQWVVRETGAAAGQPEGQHEGADAGDTASMGSTHESNVTMRCRSCPGLGRKITRTTPGGERRRSSPRRGRDRVGPAG